MRKSPYASLLIFLCAINGTTAKKMLRDIGNTTLVDVEFELAEELAGHIPRERIQEMEAGLKSMYATFPKNSAGRIGHQTVRYALHRLFVYRHSWYIKGLEPTSNGEPLSASDWVPGFVQSRLENHLGKNGMDLHELGVLAAVLEDLIRNEAINRLKEIYEVLQLPTDQPISREQADDAIVTYNMVHLLGGKKNISISNPEEVAKKRKIFVAKYRNYTDFEEWFSKLKSKHISSDSQEDVPFETMSTLVQDFGAQYGFFNDVECRQLKGALTAHEGRGRRLGRVRLSDFYNMSRYSHWKLHEKAEYLRDLGALDETNASFPQVIVPNYVTSRPNCLEATPLYAICCRDECEDLIATLEREIARPRAHPDKIAELVSTLPSDTVVASAESPRVLSESLVSRLQDIAALHYGEVDIHSRLFAQWMHHAFPRECPYPHIAGTTNPLTADEWIANNGHDSQLASDEEIQNVLSQSCSADGPHDCDHDDEGTELHWSHVDQLLESNLEVHEPPPPTGALQLIFLLTVGLWVAFGVYLGRFGKGLQRRNLQAVGTFVVVVFVVVGAVALDLVDKEVIGFVVILGLIGDLVRHALQMSTDRHMTLPKVM